MMDSSKGTDTVNTRFLNACFREPVDQTPVWMMRQAGRYLPEYRAIRADHSFLEMCKTPALAAEVTVQPIDRLGVDAAIMFNDILTLPGEMGLDLSFKKDHGPQFSNPVRTADDVRALKVPEPRRDMAYVVEAIQLIKEKLADRVPLIGFAGAPFTVASYMVEGQGSKDYAHIKGLALREPDIFAELMNRVTDATIAYLNAQIEAGVDAVQVFDTWAGQLPEHIYLERVLPHVQRLFRELIRKTDGRRIATIYFAKGSGGWLHHLRTIECDVLGMDWTVDLARARAALGDRYALQGNLDPTTLLTTPDIIRAEVHRVLASFGSGPGHIFNLGHGILPSVPPEHAQALIDAVRSYPTEAGS